MTDYYEHFRIEPTASHEEIKMSLDEAFRQMQQKKAPETEYRMLREAQDTLLNPMTRVEYDKKLCVESPPAEQEASCLIPRKLPGILLGGVGLLLLIVALFYLPHKLRKPAKPLVNPGVYLLSSSTGENSAVLRKFDPEHDFADGGKRRGYEILVLDSGDVLWITEGELISGYSAGSYAPRDLVSGPGK